MCLHALLLYRQAYSPSSRLDSDLDSEQKAHFEFGIITVWNASSEHVRRHACIDGRANSQILAPRGTAEHPRVSQFMHRHCFGPILTKYFHGPYTYKVLSWALCVTSIRGLISLQSTRQCLDTICLDTFIFRLLWLHTFVSFVAGRRFLLLINYIIIIPAPQYG